MKIYVSLLLSTLMLTACSQKNLSQSPIIGGDTDAHGCLASAGQQYSFVKQACVQVFDVADIKLDDPMNDTLAVYAILSDDRMQAELFWASHGGDKSILMDVVKGGYVSKDGKIRLIRQNNHWQLRY